MCSPNFIRGAHITNNVTANHTQPFRQTEKDAKIYSQQKSERSCEYDDYKRRKTGATA